MEEEEGPDGFVESGEAGVGTEGFGEVGYVVHGGFGGRFIDGVIRVGSGGFSGWRRLRGFRGLP